MRSKFGADDWLVIAAALTNGSNTTEQFHFYDETDSNTGKTGQRRGLSRQPAARRSGWSSAFRAATARRIATTSNLHPMWFYGVDLHRHTGARRPQGAVAARRAPPAIRRQDVYELDLHGGGYVELDSMLTRRWAARARLNTGTRSSALGDASGPT